ncbi:M20 family metallopeptidase [Aquihabitans sp. G128]|uniref:M20 family metallopeptidase n=1 Tax=Aquihabitans sp. G128 TaxID=2849779 RepID=UPI001C23352F|nr:M20 family metallopeptidase [Aquihabitans sp. G128]QXC61944.1 M20 family metallopeptidase [Aquihabitans sp. G128]
MVDLAAVKDRIDQVVDDHAEVLLAASHDIHAHPELGFAEHHAHEVLTRMLEDAGLSVTRRAYGLETAFEATAGSSDGPTVAVLCEYDALPGIGHACGHNVIGTAGVGAGIAAAAVAEELGGRLVVLGTPAEEGGGGKIFLAQEGAFEGVDAALMVHPAGMDLSRFGAIAIQQVEVTYHGKAAHAAAAPQAGRNALDAAVLGYVNVAALRQHIRPDERVHGIFTEAGEAANVVPDRAAATWYVRSPTVRGLEKLKARVLACLEAGASASGCTMEHHWVDPAFANMVDNDPMIERYRANLARTGRTLVDPSAMDAVVGSTDMGNVSHIVASIHPMIAVSPPDVAIHTKDFVRFAGGDEGDRAVLDGAKAMAATVADLWAEPGALDEAKAAFAEARESGRATGRPTI